MGFLSKCPISMGNELRVLSTEMLCLVLQAFNTSTSRAFMTQLVCGGCRGVQERGCRVRGVHRSLCLHGRRQQEEKER